MQQTKSLLTLQTELIDKKVEVAVNNNTVEFRQELAGLRQELVDFRQEFVNFKVDFRQEFVNFKYEICREIREIREEIHGLRFELGTRLTAVETALGMRSQKQAEIRNRFLDYSFKAGWVAIFMLVPGIFSFLGVAVSLHKLL